MDALTDRPLNFDEPEHVRMLRASVARFAEAEMPRATARPKPGAARASPALHPGRLWRA